MALRMPVKRFRFGVFEVCPDTGELCKSGIKIKIQDQPFEILRLLLARAGDVVTREELRQKLWPEGTFVEFDRNLNVAVKKLRDALGDSANTPRFIETLPRRGYRFIAPVEAIEPSVARSGEPEPPGEPAPRRQLIGTAAILTVAAVSAVALIWFSLDGGTEPALRSTPLTSYLGEEEYPAFSPGGNEITFSWNGQAQDNSDIYRKEIGSGENLLRLTVHPDRDYSPAWSPDGRWIAFLRGEPLRRNSLVVVPALGGVERAIAEVDPGELGPGHPPSRKLAWASDSAGLVVADCDAATNERGLFLLTADSREKRRLTKGHDAGPALSPDGRALAFSRFMAYAVSDIFVVRLAGDFSPVGEPRRVNGDVGTAASPAWTADGEDIVFVGIRDGVRTLWRVAADGSARPRPLALGEAADFPTVSPRGTRLAYSRRQNRRLQIWRLDLPERREAMFRQIASTGGESGPAFSRDGRRVAFTSGRSGVPQIWASNSNGTAITQLTFFDTGLTGSPRWSPDGMQLAFDSSADGQFEIYVVNAAGGKPRRLTDHSATDVVPSWSADGKWVYFSSDRGGDHQVWKAPSKGGDPLQVTRRGGFSSEESSDGKTLYYLKGNELAFSVWSLPLAGGEEKCVIEAIHRRCFAVTERGIYFVATGKHGGRSIEFLSFEPGEVRRIATLEAEVTFGFAISTDTRTFLYTRYVQPEADLMVVENFR